MKRIVAVTLLLLGSLFTLPLATHPTHGALSTGIVCIAPATSTQCPTPFTAGNVSVGSSFLIGVFIDNSEAMGGFDIYVSVDLTYLHPNSAALGTLIVTPSQTSICVNNVSTTGACTTNSANGPGVVEATTIESTGGNECGGNAPCSGMAFTINYTVVAKTSSALISYPSVLSCGLQTSVGDNTCVSVQDNSGTVLPETIQTGSFTSIDPTANFFATPRIGPAPLTVMFDASISAPTPTHTITSYDWTFADGNTTILTGPTLSRTVSHVYYAAGNYRPNLQTMDSSGNVSTIVDTLTISVLEDNFSIAAGPASLSIQTGRNNNFTITLTSINQTSGTINLSNNSSNTLGIIGNWTSKAIGLLSGRSVSTHLMISIPSSTSPGTYNINITGTYNLNVSKTSQTTVKHSSFIAITVTSFTYILSNSGDVDVIKGSSGSTRIQLTLRGSIPPKPVTLSLTPASIAILPTGVTYSFSPPSVIPSLTGNSSILTIRTTLSTPVSVTATTITVTGTPIGNHLNNTLLNFFVTDFSIVASPTSVSVPQGGNGNSVVSLIGGSGFNGNISLTVKSLSNNIIACCNQTSILVTQEMQGLPTLYIIVKPMTRPGPYNITVTGAIGPLTHSFNVTVTVPTPGFSASSAPSSLSITAGTTGTSTINLIGLNGFAGTITLSANSSATLGISTSLSATSVTITSTGPPVASTLTISITATTAAGTYAINVTATSNGISHSTIVTLIIASPQSSVQLAAATISTQSVTAGESVSMTVSVTNSGTSPVNMTITMDVNSGTGSNVTVAQKTITLNPGQAAQMITLTWNTTQWSGANYHVYARIIGSQTTTINQAQSAGTVALSSPPSSPPPADLSIIPWISTGILAAVAVVLGLLLFRRRRPIGPMESA